MPENFAEAHRNVTFNNNVTATLRQEPGMLYPLCGTQNDYSGSKAARIENRFGRLRMRPRTERNGDTNNADLNSLARHIKVGPSYNIAPLIDRDDKKVTEVDLTSPAVRETADAARTYHDDMFGIGYFGNGWEGETGDTAVAFKAANILAHGGTGVTKAKLIDMRELIRKRNNKTMREKPIMFLFPEDESQLLSIQEYADIDTNDFKPLVDGEIKPWLGFRFVCVNPDAESLPDSYALYFQDAGATRRLPVFMPSGMHRGVWTEFWGKISERDDKSFSEQIYGEARSACVRTDEDKCFIFQSQG